MFPIDFRNELRRKLEAGKRAVKGKTDPQTIDKMLDEFKT
jgi:hypothetical protein